MTLSLDEIQSRISHYQSDIKTCHYVGEICLDEEELKDFAIGLKKYKTILGVEKYNLGLLVLSVNICYYYYDDNGFWVHFNNITNIDEYGKVGQSIESSLVTNNLLKVQRNGPFRYVGAILEQCGVSKRYIPSFVNVLTQMNSSFISSKEMEFSKVKNVIRIIHCAKYLKDFLLDDEGVSFTLLVLKNLKMYEQGFLDEHDLFNLSGFRPGFWQEVLKYYERKHRYINDKITEKPVLKINVETLALEMVFPSKEIYEGMKDKHLYEYPVTTLSDTNMLRKSYNGEIDDANGKIQWEIQGWESELYPVLFNKINRTLIPKNNKINPGRYYLVAPESFLIPKEMSSKLLGKLNFAIEPVFFIYDVQISHSEKTVPNLEVYSGKSHDVNIYFDNPEDKSFDLHQGYYNVFLTELPNIIVSDFSLIEKNQVGLFYDFGREKGRIKTRKELDNLNLIVKKNVPFKGKVWVETLVRTTNITSNIGSDLNFYVIPNLNMEGKDDLFFLNESPKLRINNSSKIEVNIKESHRDGEMFILPNGAKHVYGEIAFDPYIIDFNFSLKRIGLLNDQGRVLRYIEISKIPNDTTFILFGPYNTEFTLQYENGIEITKNKFNDKGISIITVNQLLAPLKDFKGFLSIIISINNMGTPLRSHIIDTDKFFRNYKEFKTTHDPKINKIVKLLDYIIKNESKEAVRLNNTPLISKEFDQKFLSYFYCAKVLDEKMIEIEQEKVGWAQFIEDNHELHRVLNAYYTNTWDSCINNFRLALPPIKRWMDTLDGYIRTNSPNQPLMIYDWSNEIKSSVFNLQSPLSKQQGGRQLSHAWISYTKSNVNEALMRLNNIPEPCSDIVYDLREILRIMLFIRQARFKSIDKQLKKSWKTLQFKQIRIFLDALVSRLNGEISELEEEVAVTQESRTLIKSLPFKVEDINLFNYYISFLDFKIINQDDLDIPDWLSCWLVFNLFKDNDVVKKEVIKSLESLKNNIPPSIERETILEIINKSVRGLV